MGCASKWCPGRWGVLSNGCLLEQVSGRMDLSVTLWRICLLLCGSVCYYSGFRTCGLPLSSTRMTSPIWLGASQRPDGGGCRRRTKAGGYQRPAQGVVEEKVQGCRGDIATHNSYALKQLPQLPPPPHPCVHVPLSGPPCRGHCPPSPTFHPPSTPCSDPLPWPAWPKP